MNKEEMEKMFEKHLAYNQACIPPDDIYMVHEQTLMTCMFFLDRWRRVEDVPKVYETDPFVRKHVDAVLDYVLARENGQMVKVNMVYKTEQEFLDENSNPG